MTAVEMLRYDPETDRARQALDALASACPVPCIQTRAYDGLADTLVLWGPGAPNRFPAILAQVGRGGHVIALDGAYWQRDRKFRVSIDAPHPQSWVLSRHLDRSRLDADAVIGGDYWDPNGPVLVAGVGAKATVQYGAEVIERWEQAQVARARKAGVRVLYRPKLGGKRLPGVELARPGAIDAVLAGSSALVTWHSNVAVDAIRLGIPPVCRDGAAAAVADSEWRPGLKPLSAEWRQRFLTNLAWFQWAPNEAAACWAFLRETLA